LAAVRTITTLNRIQDVLSLTAADRRIQTVFALDVERPALLGAGVPDFLAALGAKTWTWPHAVRQRVDLVLAASENDDLDAFEAPVVLVPHGLGQQKFYPGTNTVSGLDPHRAVRATFVLAHTDQVRHLREARPDARAQVVGDPALARMLASAHRAETYRQAFDDQGRRLVVLASTWGPDSLVGQWPDLPERLAAALPLDEYQLLIVLHPGVWAAHSPWQIRQWLAGAGIRVIPPEDGWQAALLAAYAVLSDHGSLAPYAALLGRRLLLAPRASPMTVPGSASELLAQQARRLDPRLPLRPQIDTATIPSLPDVVDSPHSTATRLRTVLYSLLRLSEPAYPAVFATVPVPDKQINSPAVMIAGVGETENVVDEVAIQRFPAIDADTGSVLRQRHVVADLERAGLDALGGATVLLARASDGVAASRLLAEWPRAVLIACVDEQTCQVWTRDDNVRLSGRLGPIDPGVLASFAYVGLRRTGVLPRQGTLRIGEQVIAVAAC
jgi:hypothetical protein